MSNKRESLSNTPDEEYPQGLVLWIILNEVLFDIRKQFLTHGKIMFDDRIGADKDESKIEEALRPFNVELRIWSNFTLAETLRALDAVKKEADNNPTKFAGLVFCGMSHGFSRTKEYLITSDSKMLDLAYVSEKFHNFNCVGFKNKPKSFIYNICRGETSNIEITKHLETSIEMDNAIEALEMESDSTDAFNTPGLEENGQAYDEISFKKGDYLICHSTVSGYVSNRHRRFGSPFIQELAVAINGCAAQQYSDYEEMFRVVRSATAKHQYSGSNAPQLPEMVSTLRAKFILPIKRK